MVVEHSAETPEWVRSFNRRRRRTLSAVTIGAAGMVGGFLVKLRLGVAPNPGWWGVAIMLSVLMSGVFAYCRWTTSDRYCRSLPSARRFPAESMFSRCLLIDRSDEPRAWVDRAGVVVLDATTVTLCRSGADLPTVDVLRWSEIQSIDVVGSRVRLGRFVEIRTQGTSSRLYCQRSAVKAIERRAHDEASRACLTD